VEEIKQAVRDRYGAVARGSLGGAHAGADAVARAFGYSREELALLPPRQTWGSRVAIPLPWPVSGRERS
jgi:hypothetical protein